MSKYNTKDLIQEIIEAVRDRKGKNIVVIDLEKVDGASTSAFVIATGRSTSQVSAIADSVRERVQKNTGEKPVNIDGYRNSQWIILDYGHVMVHIFLPETREFYRLEELWNDGEINRLPDED